MPSKICFSCCVPCLQEVAIRCASPSPFRISPSRQNQMQQNWKNAPEVPRFTLTHSTFLSEKQRVCSRVCHKKPLFGSFLPVRAGKTSATLTVSFSKLEADSASFVWKMSQHFSPFEPSFLPSENAAGRKYVTCPSSFIFPLVSQKRCQVEERSVGTGQRRFAPFFLSFSSPPSSGLPQSQD